MTRKKRKDCLSEKKDWLIEQLRGAAAKYGQPLGKRKLKEIPGAPSVSTYEKYFGTWNNAKTIAGINLVSKGEGVRKKKRKEVLRDVPLKLRFRILARDKFTCQYCGRGVEDGAKLMIDHRTPYAKGGLTEEANLLTACFECNIGKTDILIDWNKAKKS